MRRGKRERDIGNANPGENKRSPDCVRDRNVECHAIGSRSGLRQRGIRNMRQGSAAEKLQLVNLGIVARPVVGVDIEDVGPIRLAVADRELLRRRAAPGDVRDTVADFHPRRIVGGI